MQARSDSPVENEHQCHLQEESCTGSFFDLCCIGDGSCLIDGGGIVGRSLRMLVVECISAALYNLILEVLWREACECARLFPYSLAWILCSRLTVSWIKLAST
eukprot:192042-Amphidinium_carterae.1